MGARRTVTILRKGYRVMLDLNEIRKQIDATDQEIVRLFEQRMRLTQQVAEYKIETGKPVFDPERERSKLETLGALASGAFNKRGVQELFQQIMSISRKRQYQLLAGTKRKRDVSPEYSQVEEIPADAATVVFQGVEGAYSFAAMKEFFGDGVHSFHVETWKDAMEAISQGKADYAVLPIENSTAGSVLDIYDLLVEYPHYIVGEQIIPVDHVLMGIPGAKMEKLTEVYSHPQALAQSKRYLEQHPDWKQTAVLNTAVAAKMVAESGDRTKAAIASRYAAEHFGLQILDQEFVSSNNETRFVILSGKPCFKKDARKISVYIELPHETGSLYNILSHIIYNGLNMTKIESRPIPKRNWEYRFFVDFEGNLGDAAVQNALLGIGAEAKKIRVYGNY